MMREAIRIWILKIWSRSRRSRRTLSSRQSPLLHLDLHLQEGARRNGFFSRISCTEARARGEETGKRSSGPPSPSLLPPKTKSLLILSYFPLLKTRKEKLQKCRSSKRVREVKEVRFQRRKWLSRRLGVRSQRGSRPVVVSRRTAWGSGEAHRRPCTSSVIRRTERRWRR